jgi:hypothetical protein
MLALRALALVAGLAASAFAQEVKDGVYTNEKLNVRLAVPAGVKLEPSDVGDIVCEFKGEGDLILSGKLEAEESGDSPEQAANALEEIYRSVEGTKSVKRERDEKPKRSPGEWLLREYAVDLGDYKMRNLYLFVKNEGKLYTLSIDGSEDGWKEMAKTAYAIADGFDFASAPAQGPRLAPSGAPNEPATPAAPAPAMEPPPAAPPAAPAAPAAPASGGSSAPSGKWKR